MKNKPVLIAAALAAGTILALAAPLAASAHVTIGPNQAAAGSYPVIEFKVPTESATANTSKIELTIPQDTPFGYVSYVPVAGWDVELVSEELDTPVTTDDGTVTEAVTRVIWIAQPGSEITPEQYGIFPLSLGPVPDTGSIVLAVDQTYTDGTVVSWSEIGEDAEHPAPVLYVNDAPVDHHGGDEGDETEGVDLAVTDSGTSGSGDVLARVLAVGGLVVGVIGLVVGITGRRKTSA